jgi:hypothetical protein
MVLREDLVGSHARWKRPCLQTAHMSKVRRHWHARLYPELAPALHLISLGETRGGQVLATRATRRMEETPQRASCAGERTRSWAGSSSPRRTCTQRVRSARRTARCACPSVCAQLRVSSASSSHIEHSVPPCLSPTERVCLQVKEALRVLKELWGDKRRADQVSDKLTLQGYFLPEVGCVELAPADCWCASGQQELFAAVLGLASDARGRATASEGVALLLPPPATPDDAQSPSGEPRRSTDGYRLEAHWVSAAVLVLAVWWSQRV